MAALERCFWTVDREGTEALAEALGRDIRTPLTIALVGELGSGKTAFVRGLARGLEVEDLVSSPTFTLMHEYVGRLPLRHFDAWMQEREEDFLESGAAELLEGEAVVAVEWAGRIEDWLPRKRLVVVLEARGRLEPGSEEGQRVIHMSLASPDPLQEALLAGLAVPAGVQEKADSCEPIAGDDVSGAT